MQTPSSVGPDLLAIRDAQVQRIHESAAREEWGGRNQWIGDLMIQHAVRGIDARLGLPIEDLRPPELPVRVALSGLVRHMDATSRYASTLPIQAPYTGNPALQQQLNHELAQRRQERISLLKDEVSRTAGLVAWLSGEDESSLIKSQRHRVDAYSQSYETGRRYDQSTHSPPAPEIAKEVLTGKVGGKPLGRYEEEKSRLEKARAPKRRGPIKRFKHWRYRRYNERYNKKHRSN